jgi:hypothetical protein
MENMARRVYLEQQHQQGMIVEVKVNLAHAKLPQSHPAPAAAMNHC